MCALKAYRLPSSEPTYTTPFATAGEESMPPPQPSNTASIARSRGPFLMATSGAFSNACASLSDSQFPTRTPGTLHSCNASGEFRCQQPVVCGPDGQLPHCGDPYVIDTELRPRASRATRQALTVALVRPARGSCEYQAKNSSSPRLYTRLVIGEETLSRTSAFSLCQSDALDATTSSFILSPFNGQYLAILSLPIYGTLPTTQVADRVFRLVHEFEVPLTPFDPELKY